MRERRRFRRKRPTSEAAELALGDGARFGCDEVAEAIGSVIPADPVLVGIDLQHILRPGGLCCMAGRVKLAGRGCGRYCAPTGHGCWGARDPG